ncbi:MAG: oligosaccharide flippase family protein [Candidatus Krumholzibacteriota bacterium]|nr:oligosaccharide flippase family protein [Candidatus Krumholzibacteriota bacterium]
MSFSKIGIAMSWNVVAKLARFVAGPAAYIIIVRSLGEYRWGILSVLKSVTGFAFIIIMMGGGKGLLKFLPELRVRGGMKQFLNTVKKLFVIQTLVWLIMILAVWLLSDTIEGIYDVESGSFRFLLVVAVGFILFQVMMTVIMNILQSWYETKLLSFVLIGGNVSYLLLLLLFINFFDLGIMGVFLAGGISNALMVLLLFPKASGLVTREKEESPDVPGLDKFIKFSLPFVITGILNQIVWRQSEVLFLGHFTGMVEAGYFELAYRIPQMVLEFIPLSIWPLVMAGISESYSRDKKSLPRAVDLYFRLIYIIIIPITVMGFAFSKELIPLLYGVKMTPAGTYTQLFFIVFSYSFLYTPVSMALYVMGKSWVNMLVFLFLAILNICLDIVLIPAFGLLGAFVPVAFVLFVAVVIFNIVIKRFGRDIKVPIKFISKCYLAAVPAGLLVFTASIWNSPVMLALQVIVGCILVILGFRWMKIIGDREREIIMKLPIPFKEIIISVF